MPRRNAVLGNRGVSSQCWSRALVQQPTHSLTTQLGQRPYMLRSREGERRPGHVVRTSGAATTIAVLDTAQNTSLRRVLPVYRTTPVVALQNEVSIPPVEVSLDRIIRRFAARLWTLPDTHPPLLRLCSLPSDRRPAPLDKSLLPAGHLALSAHVRQAAVPPLDLDPTHQAHARSFVTVLTSHARRIDQRLGRVHTTVWEPWTLPLASHPRVTVSLGPREAAIAEHQRLLTHARSADAVIVYSDASVRHEGKGVGITCRHGDAVVLERCWNVEGNVEVFDLEVWGIQAALGAALDVAGRSNSKQLQIFTDNLSAARVALATPCGSSQAILLRLQRLVRAWLEADDEHHFTLAWIPGHAEIPGNERADELARLGAETRDEGRTLRWEFRSQASFRRWDTEQASDAWETHWQAAAPKNPHYAHARPNLPSPRPSPDLHLPRRVLGYLLASRTGHGDFAPYHERFGHQDASLLCRCGARKTPEHPLTCHTFLQHQHHLLDHNGHLSTRWILNSRAGSAAFARYVRSSDAYNCNHMN